MPTRETAPLGAPCWVDLLTSDVQRSRDFYSRLFGWEPGEPIEEYGGYFNFTKDGHEIAGCMKSIPEARMPDGWTIHLATDDVTKTLELAAAHGATINVPAMPVGDIGIMSHVSDPTGAGVGIWQAKQFHGFREFGENNTPAWFELHTQDYAAAVTFYRDVLRWDTHVVSDAPEFRYTVLKHGDDWLAGILDASAAGEAGPSYWSLYLGVADTDAALSRAGELGATVLEPATDTPYGRIAAITDPTGAALRLVGPNEQMPARES